MNDQSIINFLSMVNWQQADSTRDVFIDPYYARLVDDKTGIIFLFSFCQ